MKTNDERKINPIDAKIGANLEHIRLSRGVTREKLGQQLTKKISGQAIELYENGRNRISASTLVELAMILQCRLADLFLGVEASIKECSEGIEIFDRHNAKLLRNALSSEEVQQAMQNLTKAITTELTHHFTQKGN